ncbi:hypothetical protein [Ruegeria atlantica]|uniref:hypothetical protein n=1 Tax=Ruegeria atlantica TaxID=81569 RepID=UPI00147AB101|nr:hypothetical protein [Ruegeria atlantica]
MEYDFHDLALATKAACAPVPEYIGPLAPFADDLVKAHFPRVPVILNTASALTVQQIIDSRMLPRFAVRFATAVQVAQGDPAVIVQAGEWAGLHQGRKWIEKLADLRPDFGRCYPAPGADWVTMLKRIERATCELPEAENCPELTRRRLIWSGVPNLPADYGVYLAGLALRWPVGDFMQSNTPGPVRIAPVFGLSFESAVAILRGLFHSSLTSFDCCALACEMLRMHEHIQGKEQLHIKRPRRIKEPEPGKVDSVLQYNPGVQSNGR